MIYIDSNDLNRRGFIIYEYLNPSQAQFYETISMNTLITIRYALQQYTYKLHSNLNQTFMIFYHQTKKRFYLKINPKSCTHTIKNEIIWNYE